MLNADDTPIKINPNQLLKILRKNQTANKNIIKKPNQLSDIHNISITGKRIINKSIDLNFNSTLTKDMKYKLEKQSRSIGSNSNNHSPMKTVRNNKSRGESQDFKSPILMRSLNQQGHGLWAQDLSKIQKYDRSEVIEIINSDIYSKKTNLSEDFHKDEDKKIIEILRYKLDDMTTQIQRTLVKFAENDYKTQRAEQLKEDYYILMKKNLEENKDFFEKNEFLNNQVSALTQSLNFAKKELERLDKENTDLKSGEGGKDKIISNLEKRVEMLLARNQKSEAENNSNKFKISEMSEKIKGLEAKLERNSREGDSSSANNSKSSTLKLEQKILEQAEEIVKLQLNIVDLKKKLSEDEKLRCNLFDIIKAKKEKNKNLKFKINEIAYENEETGKENKWSHDLVLQKENRIKIQKEKIESLLKENKNLNKQLHKYNGIKKVEKGVETDPIGDIVERVRPTPTVFKTKNY